MSGYLRRYWLEAGAITGLVAAAASPFVPVLRLRLPLSGAVGIYAEDQLQYFAWIREATTHILAGDRFDLAPGIRSFLHPVFAVSGIIHAASGLPIPLCYLLWEPVAIGLLAVAFSRYVRRLLHSQQQQAAALALALFAVSPFYLILRALPGSGRDIAAPTADFSREVWIAGHLWGYQVTAIAVGLMPLVLLSLDSWRRTSRASPPFGAVFGTVLISWLHPWQGATLILTIGIAECLESARSRQRPRAGVLVIALAAAVPALYYLLLARFDPVWQIYQRQNSVITRPLLPPLFAVLPLAAPAALAFQRRANDWQEVVVRIWPLAAFTMYFAPFGAFPSHALQGIALPLSILAVEGFTRAFGRPWRVVVVGLIGLVTLPAWADSVRTVAAKAASGEHGYFIRAEERRALALLEQNPQPGGVLTTPSTGALVPYATGREAYVGHDSWSPEFHERARRAEDLFRGQMPSHDALAFVRSTHARFLLSDCRHQADLEVLLAPVISSVTRFGCATVYELRVTPDMEAAAGVPDA